MFDSKSRFISLQENWKPAHNKSGELKNGQEYKIFHNKFGRDTISCLLNWKNGFLHSEPDLPAVQMDDGHVEYWKDGVLHNDEHDSEGNLMPAVIAEWGRVEEYWINGTRIKSE